MGRDPPRGGTSLLIRNLARSARAEDIRYAASKYGNVRDVYLPVDYYTKEPRGIGFVEFYDARDAEDCKYGLDGQRIDNREVKVVFAERGRKRPEDFQRGGGGGRSSGYGGDRDYDRRDPYYDRRDRGGYERDRDYVRGQDRYYDRPDRDSDRRDRGGYDRRRSFSRERSPRRGRSPVERGGSRRRDSRGPSPVRNSRERLPPREERGRSPYGGDSPRPGRDLVDDRVPSRLSPRDDIAGASPRDDVDISPRRSSQPRDDYD